MTKTAVVQSSCVLKQCCFNVSVWVSVTNNAQP